MKACEGIVILGGYKAQGESLGHAVLYEVERQPEGFFQLRTIDTGDYVKQDWNDWSKGKISLVYKNLLWEELCQPEALAILGNLDNTYLSMKDSHRALSSTLNSRAYWEETKVLLQQKGTCVVSSHQTWLELHLQAGSEGRAFLPLMHTLRAGLLETFVGHLRKVLSHTQTIQQDIALTTDDNVRAKEERLIQCAPRLLADAERVLRTFQNPSTSSPCTLL